MTTVEKIIALEEKGFFVLTPYDFKSLHGTEKEFEDDDKFTFAWGDQGEDIGDRHPIAQALTKLGFDVIFAYQGSAMVKNLEDDCQPIEIRFRDIDYDDMVKIGIDFYNVVDENQEYKVIIEPYLKELMTSNAETKGDEVFIYKYVVAIGSFAKDYFTAKRAKVDEYRFHRLQPLDTTKWIDFNQTHIISIEEIKCLRFVSTTNSEWDKISYSDNTNGKGNSNLAIVETKVYKNK